MIVTYMDAALTDATWSDPKKYAWPLALSVPGLAFTGFVAWRIGFAWAWWIAPVIVFGVIPAVEMLVGDERANPPDDAVRRLQQMPYYRWLTFFYLRRNTRRWCCAALFGYAAASWIAPAS